MRHYIKPTCNVVISDVLAQHNCSGITCEAWMRASLAQTGWSPTSSGTYIVAKGTSNSNHKTFTVEAGKRYKFGCPGEWNPCPERNCQCEWETTSSSCIVYVWNETTKEWDTHAELTFTGGY